MSANRQQDVPPTIALPTLSTGLIKGLTEGTVEVFDRFAKIAERGAGNYILAAGALLGTAVFSAQIILNRQDELRTTEFVVAMIMGGLLLLVGAVLKYLRLQNTTETAKSIAERRFALTDEMIKQLPESEQRVQEMTVQPF
jgi:hypothetical protein